MGDGNEYLEHAELIPRGNRIAAKMAKIMGKVGAIGHDSKNTFQKYEYTSARAVQAKLQSLLSEEGVAVQTHLHPLPGSTFHECILQATLTFVDADSGESMVAQGVGSGADKGDKAAMKATTAAIKYALSNAFIIALGDDPEKETGQLDAPTPRPGPKKARTMDDIAAAEIVDHSTGEVTKHDRDWKWPWASKSLKSAKGTPIGELPTHFLQGMQKWTSDQIMSGRSKDPAAAHKILGRITAELITRGFTEGSNAVENEGP